MVHYQNNLSFFISISHSISDTPPKKLKKRGRKREDYDQACRNQDCDVFGIVNHEDVIRNSRQKNGEQEYECN